MNDITITLPRNIAEWQKDSNTLLRRRTEKELENIEYAMANMQELAKTLPHLDYGSRVKSQREYIEALKVRIAFIDAIDAALTKTIGEGREIDADALSAIG